MFPAIALAGLVLYHFSLKKIPHTVNPFFSLMWSYLLAAFLCGVAQIFFTTGERQWASLNWSQWAVGVGAFLIEVGFILWYRSGWPITTGALIVNGAGTIILTIIGVLALGDRLSWQQVVGFFLCLGGLYFLTAKPVT